MRRKWVLSLNLFSLLFLLHFQTDLILRRIKVAREFYPQDLYNKQFEYYKPLKKAIDYIEKKWKVEIGSLGINENDLMSKSWERIRGEIYRELEQNQPQVWSKLKEEWEDVKKEEKKIGEEIIHEIKGIDLQSKNIGLSLFVADEDTTIENYINKIKNGEFKIDNIFSDDFNFLKSKINGLKNKGGTILIIPETIHGMMIDMYVFSKLLSKGNVKIKFLVRKSLMEEFPMGTDFDDVKNELYDNYGISLNNIEKIEVDLKNPGVHLDELGEEAKKEIMQANLLIIKGGTNAVTTQYINKEHFLVGVVKDRQTAYFTGLSLREKKASPFIAFVPRRLAVGIQYDRYRPTIQNLNQFVRVKIDIRKKLNDIEIDRINSSGLGIVYFKAPQNNQQLTQGNAILAEYYRQLAEKLNAGKDFKIAIKEILGNNAFITDHPIVLEKVANEKLLKKALGNKEGEYYRIYNPDKKIWANVVLIPYENGKLNFYTVNTSEPLMHPQDVVMSTKYNEQQGIVFNGAYFLSKRLIENFNQTNPSYTILEKLKGSYLGFLKKDDKVYLPLYNKGAILITKQGEIYMDRVKLVGGKLNVNGEEKEVEVNEANPGSNDIVVYTPDYERNMEGEMLEEFKSKLIETIKDMDEEDFKIDDKQDLIQKIQQAENYENVYKWIDPYSKSGIQEIKPESLKNLIDKFKKSKFNLKTPKRGNVVNVVIVGDTVVKIDKISKKGGQTVIPPFGWVLSMPESVYKEIESMINERKKFTLFNPEIECENNKDIKFKDIQLAIGGLTLLPQDSSMGEINKVMKKEGATLISSRRTQETDFAMIDEKGPRQVLGLVEKEGTQYLMVFTVSGRNRKYTRGANFMQLVELINEKIKAGGYKLKGMINLDGGSSVSTSYFENNMLYVINLPAPGPDSKFNQVRAVNSIFVIKW